MKKFILLFSLIFVFSCDSEKAIDCFQSAGSEASKTFEVAGFSKIMVGDRVKLFISEGDSLRVSVKTGDNLLPETDAYVENGKLFFENGNNCNLVRDFALVEFYVTTPKLTEIKNGSQFDVQSQGTLGFPSLTLISDDTGEEDEYHTDGDFKLEIDNDSLNIINNNLSNYFLSGSTKNFDIQMKIGDSRIEAQNLIAQHVDVFHRGTQDIIVNPRQSLKATLVSTGDLIAVHEPAILEVEEKYKGEFRIEE